MAHKSKDKADCVSLDLFVGDEDDEPHSSSQNAVETLCLRILSKRGINYRFGGLQLHVKSPDFHVGKSFHVNLDENNRIDSIESYREPEDSYLFGRRRVSLLGSNNLGTSPARILITPKKAPETEANAANVGASGSNSVQASEATNGTATNKVSANKQLPILTADVVVEEVRPQEKTIPEGAVQPNQSLGSALVNTLLNKKPNNQSNASSLANSNANSPSQSIHSINSLSSSMLELRTSSPINPASSSPEKLISKLTLQAFGHSDKENKYIKNKKNKKYDFKKRSKEKLLKNGEKNQENGSGQQTAASSTTGSKAGVDKKPENCKQPDKSVPAKEEPKESERVSEKANKKVNSKCDKKLASDHNLSIESAKKNPTVQTKSIGVCTHHLDASCLSLNLQEGFFFNLRRTRSWKK